jgi:circadian clock protein KaiC
MRNMRSIGLDLAQWVKKGLLKIIASRPGAHGLEMHLVLMHKMVRDFEPRVVILDPISNFIAAATALDAQSMLIRMIDFLKMRQVTGLFTNLTGGDSLREQTDIGVSSLIDTWILLRDIELGGERNHGIYVLKSRGMKHSNQIREFLITPEGIQLQDVYVGPEGVLTGSMRAAQEARETAAALGREQETLRKEREFVRRRTALEAQLTALTAELQSVEDEAGIVRSQDAAREKRLEQDRSDAGTRRGGDAAQGTKRRVK